jgi:hypothetical protein
MLGGRPAWIKIGAGGLRNGRNSKRSVFLAVMVWFGYFRFSLDMVPFTAETGRKYKLTASDKLGLRN